MQGRLKLRVLFTFFYFSFLAQTLNSSLSIQRFPYLLVCVHELVQLCVQIFVLLPEHSTVRLQVLHLAQQQLILKL